MNEPKLSERFWTVPNVLSLGRILLVFPILYLFRYPSMRTYVFVLTVIAYATDFFDGMIARVFHCQSRVGTLLDPLGDKLLAVTLAAVLYIRQEVPFMFFVVVASRDIIIALGAIYAINMYRYVFLPLVVGKLTTFSLGLFYCSLLFEKTPWASTLSWLPGANRYLMGGVMGLVLFSGLAYVVNYIRYFVESKKSS
ncbi:MAG: CDP-alcohol phosphatidyltransferase family protein [Brevinematales bacterium]|nr:CDP-alcohol phosphatidyltransferase family protein [Brevinematales bacterium]